MKEVIRIDKVDTEQDEPVELTHVLGGAHGYSPVKVDLWEFTKIVYLGHCPVDGDMFAAYGEFGSILIYKGYLNSGKY